MDELVTLFRFNDAVLRNLIIKCKDAITEESFILKGERESKERRARAEQKRQLEEESALEAPNLAEEVNDQTASEEFTREPDGLAEETDEDRGDSNNAEVEEPEVPEEE